MKVPILEEELKLSDAEFKAKYNRSKPSAENDVVFHCRMGGRGGKAAELAEKLGFKNAKNYKGSYFDWLEKEKK